MYVLDTNIVAYFFRNEGRVAERLLGVPPREIAIPAIVTHELRYGLARTPNANRPNANRLAEQLNTLLSWITILPFDDAVATIAAAVRVQIESIGRPIGPLDVLIGATCLAAHATLVTRNVKEFGHIANLRIENWFD